MLSHMHVLAHRLSDTGEYIQETIIVNKRPLLLKRTEGSYINDQIRDRMDPKGLM